MIEQIVSRYKAWKDRRYLKKHGCENWTQYHRRFDPYCNVRAEKVVDYYHGYRYITRIENNNHYCYKLVADYGPGGRRYGYEDMIKWCEENCQGHYRFDFLRVFSQTPIGLNGVEEPEWYINEIGGSDYMFFAFQNEDDTMMFGLRWS